MSHTAFNRAFAMLGIALALAPLAWGGQGPDINPDEIKMDPGNSVFTTDTVTLSVAATSPDGLTLSYKWDFGDGTAPVTTATGTTTHLFAAEGDYLVDVEVSDGVNPAVVQAEIIEVVAPPAPTSPPGTDVGDVEINPDNGFSITVGIDSEGVVQLVLSDVPRATNSFNTNFSDTPGRTFRGSRPTHQFDAPGIFTATTTVTDDTSGSEQGKVRKSLVMSRRDLNLPPLVTAEPASHDATVTKVKGKVRFDGAAKNDLISVTWTIELPVGLDLGDLKSKEPVKLELRDVTLSIGNLTETITLDSHGKGLGTLLFKKVSVKYPKLPKGETLTTAGMIATVTAQLSAIGLVNAGLDTEGISPRAKTSAPKIQVAMLMGGVGYSNEAAVELKVSKKQDSAIIGRATAQ